MQAKAVVPVKFMTEKDRERERETGLVFLSYGSRYVLLRFSPLMSPDRTAPYVSSAILFVLLLSCSSSLFEDGLYDRSYPLSR